MEYQPTYIILHHSAADEPSPQFAAINEWHRVRSFAPSEAGWFVGYHKVIEANGIVTVARGDLERDCDALGRNYDSLSVCLVGNLDKHEPTDAQTQALGIILADWCTKYNIHPTKIYPHRKFASTHCPGTQLENTWATMVCITELARRKPRRLFTSLIKW
jgi:hypothetical protein